MAKKDLNTSTSYSAARYAHPFFLPAEPGERQPINGQSRMTDWSKQQLGPIPAVANNGRIELADIIGKDGVQEITQLGEMRFHALGDSGVSHAVEAEQIAEDMATDYRPGAGGLNPTFLFHLGDVIYGPDKENHYCDPFYRPYRLYPGKIIAIPGNHDGEERRRRTSRRCRPFDRISAQTKRGCRSRPPIAASIDRP